jgi:glycosyltransferase involved in cell wall biosynthesis
MNYLRLLIIIPCYNEQESIARLLNEIFNCDQGYETLVIDDGSTDNTYRISQPLSPTIKLLRNLGIGGAVQTGIRYAKENNFDLCVQIDGDGQHCPSEVANLVKGYQKKPDSIIVGSRYLTNDTFQSTFSRRLGSRMISYALHTLFDSCNVTDPTSGMRLMDKKAIAFFADRYPHDFPEPISLAWALKAGLTIREIPVAMRRREFGISSIAGLKPIIYMFRVLGYIMLARFTRVEE